MFISQVLFEADSAHEDKVQDIMKSKLASLQNTPGLVTAECWKKANTEKAGYCLVYKWGKKEDFVTWLSGEGHRHANPDGETRQSKVQISKAAVQYELVELPL